MTVLSLTWESPYLGKTVFILRRGPDLYNGDLCGRKYTICSEMGSCRVIIIVQDWYKEIPINFILLWTSMRTHTITYSIIMSKFEYMQALTTPKTQLPWATRNCMGATQFQSKVAQGTSIKLQKCKLFSFFIFFLVWYMTKTTYV